jgi:ferrous iron transport protein A
MPSFVMPSSAAVSTLAGAAASAATLSASVQASVTRPATAARPNPRVVMPLPALPLRQAGVVVGVARDPSAGPEGESLCRRLEVLGFVPGEPVRVVAQGPFGHEPLLIEIGSTRFALRHREASCVQVALAADGGAAHGAA